MTKIKAETEVSQDNATLITRIDTYLTLIDYLLESEAPREDIQLLTHDTQELFRQLHTT